MTSTEVQTQSRTTNGQGRLYDSVDTIGNTTSIRVTGQTVYGFVYLVV
jgi:hypothetical protein